MENHRPYLNIRPHLNVTTCSHNVGSVKVFIRRCSINHSESYFIHIYIDSGPIKNTPHFILIKNADKHI